MGRFSRIEASTAMVSNVSAPAANVASFRAWLSRGASHLAITLAPGFRR